ncbi:MAG: hypothetical protein MPEBLZ_02057 [Candidatus Methanoperedens nitroreducens]|uniref:Uncharacterized protein n=1 Tax=Candidatus Methanoperedens nitratireducens TaxID=1392998 RepID=A0A0P8DZR8_9EURY|nr:MAG: hypothetical protein MPEBLZ_02057 [Candidatus Methanoperedens sp. BLZ1]
MSSPNRECSRFDKCSVNNCPLIPEYPAKVIDEADREQKCTMEKQVRFRIGSQYPNLLKFQGLTSKEWSGKQRFDSMTPEQKEQIRQKAKERLHSFKSSICLASGNQQHDLGVLEGVN